MLSLDQMTKLREAFEEIGIINTDIPPGQIIFLGKTRELIRGGHPDMFFFAKTSLSEKQVIAKWKDAKDKWGSNRLFFFNFGQIAYENLNNAYSIHRFPS